MRKLSVCIVAYKNYEQVSLAIETLENNTNHKINKEVFIVDNSDPTNNDEIWKSDYFQEKLRQYSDVVYLNPHCNLGYGKGNNYIIDKINSEYHAIVNPDIVFLEDALSDIIGYMDSHSDVGMIIPNIINEQGERQLVYRKEVTVLDMFIRMFCKGLFPQRVKSHTLQDMDFSKTFQVPFGQGSFLVIRSELFKRLGGFDDEFFMYLEDADLCKRVNQVSKLMYYPNATVVHKWEQGSHKDFRLFKVHISSMKYYFKKWGTKWY